MDLKLAVVHNIPFSVQQEASVFIVAAVSADDALHVHSPLPFFQSGQDGNDGPVRHLVILLRVRIGDLVQIGAEQFVVFVQEKRVGLYRLPSKAYNVVASGFSR